MQEIVERYIASWNETDAPSRRKLVEEIWTDQASYIDPLAEAHGRDAIDAVIAAVQAQFPGFVFTLLGPVDAHHGQAADRPWLPGQGSGLSRAGPNRPASGSSPGPPGCRARPARPRRRGRRRCPARPHNLWLPMINSPEWAGCP